MIETADSIRQWAVDTFGEATPSRTVERAHEEFDELLLACTPQDTLAEAADVVITLCNLPGLAAEIDRKMGINRARVWNVKGDGTGYHVKQDWEVEGYCSLSCTDICEKPCNDPA
jgi:hypothetical protein